jgi:HEAT repeat protein
VGRRRVIIALAACILVGIGVVVFWPREREPDEPKYQGTKLGEWLAIRDQGQERELAVHPINAIGTNAVPFLVKWVELRRPIWQDRLYAIYTKFPAPLQNKSLLDRLGGVSEQKRARNAFTAFILLGPKAESAIPELERFIRDPRTLHVTWAAMSLARVANEKALPAFIAVLRVKTTRAETRREIMSGIANVTYEDDRMKQTIPVLISCLDDINRITVSLANSALDNFVADPHLCVYALSNACYSENIALRRDAVAALGGIGSYSRHAINAVTDAIADSDLTVRRAATNSCREINWYLNGPYGAADIAR